ncbi:MAG: glycosyltransferase family 4 protein [bacterium]
MRIAIDVRALTKQPTGTGYYLKYLLDEFAQIEDEHQYYLCSSRPFVYTAPNNEARFIPIIQRGLPGNLWLQFQLPRLIKHHQIDLFHSPFGVIPFRIPCATVNTVHDLAFHFYPQLTDSKNRFLLPRLVPKSMELATAIIVDSAAIKQDLMRIYKVPERKITVIHLAPSSQYHPMPRDAAQKYLADSYHIDYPFILFVGTLEPRKNIAGLIQAYHQLPGEVQNQYKLVLVGKKGWQYQSLFNLVTKLNLENHVVFTDYIPESDLVYFYNAAAVFVYPSLYEGFGLPVIDALACGTPVVTSDTSSMPELVSYAGILTAPEDSKRIASAMSRILTDRDLANHLAEKAIIRSKLFSWADTARKTLETFTAAIRKYTVQQYQK